LQFPAVLFDKPLPTFSVAEKSPFFVGSEELALNFAEASRRIVSSCRRPKDEFKQHQIAKAAGVSSKSRQNAASASKSEIHLIEKPQLADQKPHLCKFCRFVDRPINQN